MIVISRQVGESVVIDPNIILTVVEIQEDVVQVQIENLPEATVHTQESYDSARREEMVSIRPR